MRRDAKATATRMQKAVGAVVYMARCGLENRDEERLMRLMRSMQVLVHRFAVEGLEDVLPATLEQLVSTRREAARFLTRCG